MEEAAGLFISQLTGDRNLREQKKTTFAGETKQTDRENKQKACSEKIFSRDNQKHGCLLSRAPRIRFHGITVLFSVARYDLFTRGRPDIYS